MAQPPPKTVYLDAGMLHKEIAKVCPIIRTAMSKLADRATWSFDPTPEATQQQIDAANNVIATIPQSQTAVSRALNVQALKDALVSKDILTQEQADDIFR